MRPIITAAQRYQQNHCQHAWHNSVDHRAASKPYRAGRVGNGVNGRSGRVWLDAPHQEIVVVTAARAFSAEDVNGVAKDRDAGVVEDGARRQDSFDTKPTVLLDIICPD